MPHKWRQGGTEPDYRFSLANERTFLGWIRTAFAILAGAVLLNEFTSKIGSGVLLLAVCISVALLAGYLGIAAYFRWRGNEISMRHSQPLPHSRMIFVLSLAIMLLSLAVSSLMLS
jgi:putative membrane protein